MNASTQKRILAKTVTAPAAPAPAPTVAATAPSAAPAAKTSAYPAPTGAARVAAKAARRPAVKPVAHADRAASSKRPTTAVAKSAKSVKIKKPKLVRDSFTIPKSEYSVLVELKQRADQLARPAKKSELLRAGIKALAAMTDAALLAALKVVPAIKTGRPAKS